MFQLLRNPFSSSFDKFCQEAKPLSHPKHILLHPGHSPNSRVPCTNVLSFISKMLLSGDTNSIKKLMRLLVAGNPLGTGDDWTSNAIDVISKWDVNNFIRFSSETAEIEFKAMCILFEKNGGGREFWITDRPDYSDLCSRALSGYSIVDMKNFDELAKKANSFIRKMRKDKLPYWSDFPFYKPEDFVFEKFSGTDQEADFSKLSIPTRLVLLDQIRSLGFSLNQAPRSEIKYLGYDCQETPREILQSGVMVIADDVDIILQSFSQAMLLQICQERGYEVKKSSKKEKLFEIILEKDKTFKKKFIEKNKPAKFVKEKKDRIKDLLAIAEKRKKAFQLLFFL